MTVSLHDSVYLHSGIGYDLIGWARKIKALGDIIQAESKANCILEIDARSIGVLGEIVFDYGRFIESAIEDLEDEFSEVWENLKGSRVRFFNYDVQRFKKFWKDDDPHCQEEARAMIRQIDSFIDQHDPLSLYKTREELVNLIQGKANDSGDKTRHSETVGSMPENYGSVVKLGHVSRVNE